MIYEIKLDASDWNILPASEEEEILQNVLTILLTPKYSVPLDREFGINARMVDAPINQHAKITAEVAQAIRKFEPRARLKKINFGGDAAVGQVVTSVLIELA